MSTIPFDKIFYISNPSPYVRTDYVEVDLNELGVPGDLDENDFALYHLDNQDSITQIPFQIDDILGNKSTIRVLTFLSMPTHAGSEDYSSKSGVYRLKQETSGQIPTDDDLWVHHYYNDIVNDIPPSTGTKEWHRDRRVDALKLANGSIEVNFSLRSGGTFACSTDGGSTLLPKGAATSVLLHKMERYTSNKEILSPYWWEYPNRFWGALTQVVFFPFPWERRWFHQFDLSNESYSYDLVWSKSGPVRSIVVIKAGPFKIPYDGRPFFSKKIHIECDLYRMLYMYPRRDRSGTNKPYYMEELFALSRNPEYSFSFRPYFSSLISATGSRLDIARMEHIPDYFMIWSHEGFHHCGYGFAADAHVRGFEVHPATDRWREMDMPQHRIFWRLPLSHHTRCLQYFSFLPERWADYDLFHAIGHSGWYERVFKPLFPFEHNHRFPKPMFYHHYEY